MLSVSESDLWGVWRCTHNEVTDAGELVWWASHLCWNVTLPDGRNKSEVDRCAHPRRSAGAGQKVRHDENMKRWNVRTPVFLFVLISSYALFIRLDRNKRPETPDTKRHLRRECSDKVFQNIDVVYLN